MSYANLTDANLSDVDLYYADLYKAQLSNANLTGADLRGADLRDVFGMTPEQIRAVAKTDENTKFGTKPNRPDDETTCGPQSSIGLVLHPRTTSK